MKIKIVSVILLSLAFNTVKAAEPQSLVEAAVRGDKNYIELLLGQGADINKPEELVMKGPFYVCESKIIEDVTPVLAALAYNHVPLARWMIAKGADPKYQTIDGCYQATHIAAFNGYIEPVMFLSLRYRLSLDQKDKSGFDVYQAALGGHKERYLKCCHGLYKFKEFALEAQNELFYEPLTQDQLIRAQKYIKDDVGLMNALESCDSLFVKACCENGHNPFVDVYMGSYHPYSGYSAYTYAEKLEDDLVLGYFDYLKEKGEFRF